jgi:hypothetical protein
MTELENKYESINSKNDFISFVEMLIKDLKDHPNDWETNLSNLI